MKKMKIKKIIKMKMMIKSKYFPFKNLIDNFFEINIFDNNKKYFLKVLD